MNWEVRTMPSGTLSSKGKGWFNLTLFQKNLTRFWPIWAVYAAVLFFLLPMEIILYGGRGYTRSRLISAVTGQVFNATSASIPVGVIFGLLTAMALFSYLMNSRSAGMLHALPIRREGLFLTNWVSGLCFFLVPDLVITLITLAAEAAVGAGSAMPVLRWFLAQTSVSMFFFCLAVFCAMFTGHILALPVFYGIINALVMGIFVLTDTAMEILLVGFDVGTLSGSDLGRWCTPALQLNYLLRYDTFYDETLEMQSFSSASTAAALGYCVVLGAIFTLVALTVYRCRQLERAGDLVTVGWVRPVFQYGLGVCGGVALGILLYMNFFDRFGAWSFILLAVVCAVVCAFAGRMLLKKTLRVFADGWKGCAVLAGVLLLVLAGVRLDPAGYQIWTPEADAVESVWFSGVNSASYDGGSYADYTITDPEEIAAVVDLHGAITRRLDDLKQDSESSGTYDRDSYQTETATFLRLRYTLKDGRTVSRRYDSLPIRAEALTDPDSYASKLERFINRPERIRATYLPFGAEVRRVEVSGGSLSNTGASDQEGGRYGSYDLSAQQAQVLWKAVQEDLDAGRIGRRYLLDDRERQENCFVSDIELYFSWPVVEEDGEKTVSSTNVFFTPQVTSTSTLRALEELGLRELLRGRADN
ncbi:MAG: hypothetical protein ACLSE7_13265 [Lachnospirales bacterium]